MAAFRALASYVRRAQLARDAEARCELCAARLAEAHRHVVELRASTLRCACSACAVLFTDAGAGGGRWRTVPDRVLVDPSFAPSDAEWAALGLPVGLAYLTQQSSSDSRVAFYPSPGGPISSPFDEQAWQRLAARTTLAAAAEPDVEALLLQRRRGRAAECFVAPIDACFELVGLVRRTWRGFDGGDAAWQALDGFFANLRARARSLPGGRR